MSRFLFSSLSSQKMDKIRLSLGLFLIALSGSWGSERDEHHRESTSIAQAIEDARKFWQVPGVAVVIVKEGKVGYLRGHGKVHIDRSDPVTEDTLFPLASCSKAFTTTLMAMLVDEGKLDWDDRAHKHLPTFRLSDPLASADVRLRDLVTHRTGVGGHDLLWYRAVWDTDEMIRRIGRVPLTYPFRAKFSYQSIMFTAAGKAAAKAAGKPWEELIHQRIFAPLGMQSAGCTTTEALPELRATGHRLSETGQPKPVDWYEITEPNPAGSIHLNARDLGTWLLFHLNEGKHAGKQLVSRKSLRETHTPQMVIRMTASVRELNPETHQLSYAMGWVVSDYHGHLVLAHGGIIDGFRAHLTLLPEDGIAIGLLANLHATRMTHALTNQLIDHLLGLEPRDWNAHFLAITKREQAEEQKKRKRQAAERIKGTKPSRGLADYVGSYHHPAYGEVTVTIKEDQLVWRWSSFRCPLDHYHYDTFVLRGDLLDGELVKFLLNSEGKVSVMKALGMEFTRR